MYGPLTYWNGICCRDAHQVGESTVHIPNLKEIVPAISEIQAQLHTPIRLKYGIPEGVIRANLNTNFGGKLILMESDQDSWSYDQLFA